MKRYDPQTTPRYQVPALDKGLDILELLAMIGKPQTLADMARHLDRTSSELFRMVAALEKRDYIIRNSATGEYRLSMKLYELSHMHSPVEELVRAALEPMRDLADATGESCHLSILERGHVVLVSEVTSTERVRLSVEVGSTAPALDWASGRVLLAHLLPSELDDLLDRNPDYNRLSRRKQSAVRKELELIRTDGYTIAPSTYPSVTDIAVIVGRPEIGAVAALAMARLTGGVNDGKEQHVRKLMQRCAVTVCRELRLSSARPNSGAT